MRVGDQRHAPAALTPGKRPGTGGLVGPRAGLDGCGKSLAPPPGFDPRTVAIRYRGPLNDVKRCGGAL